MHLLAFQLPKLLGLASPGCPTYDAGATTSMQEVVKMASAINNQFITCEQRSKTASGAPLTKRTGLEAAR